MRATAIAAREAAAPVTLWRCGGRQCGAGECEHDEQALHRHASQPGPPYAPPIVYEVVRSSGDPLPAAVRRRMEDRLGHDFADVRIHRDAAAADSARRVGADAYTVGRHVVFGDGKFDPSSVTGRQLLAHELTHAAESPPGSPVPSGRLKVSSPDDPAERRAVRCAELPSRASRMPAGSASLMRNARPVRLTGVRVNHSRVTVPPEAGLSFQASPRPNNATDVTFSLAGDHATIDPRTTIDSTGVITTSVSQGGGSAHVQADQSITTATPGGGSRTLTSRQTAPFHFVAVPGAVSGTTAMEAGVRGQYGAKVRQTFAGGSAIERAHVNERFAGASGTTLELTGAMIPGGARISVNDPTSVRAGWDLDSSGEMVADDHIAWTHRGATARPFVRNASNPSPAGTLPQAVNATQAFQNLSLPSNTYGATAVAGVIHQRMFRLDSGSIQAVTRALPPGRSTPEVVEDYKGPPVFQNCTATPSTVAPSAPRRRGSPPPHTVDVSVDRQGAARPRTRFSIQGRALGCRINRTGRVTIGTTAGSITVRAGDRSNFDETTITIAAPTPPTPTPPTP